MANANPDRPQIVFVTGTALTQWVKANKLTKEQAALVLGTSYPNIVKWLRKGSNHIPHDVAELVSSGKTVECKFIVAFTAAATRFQRAEAV